MIQDINVPSAQSLIDCIACIKYAPYAFYSKLKFQRTYGTGHPVQSKKGTTYFLFYRKNCNNLNGDPIQSNPRFYEHRQYYYLPQSFALLVECSWSLGQMVVTSKNFTIPFTRGMAIKNINTYEFVKTRTFPQSFVSGGINKINFK